MCEGMKEREKLECNQGQGCCIYQIPDTRGYADKGGHKERSIANDPRYLGHQKKEKNKP
jgi:hypothetical protein